jgi:predicted transcriptional regulator of viral defense system
MGYHTALAFQGKAYSLSNQFQILTYQRLRNVRYEAYEFQLIKFPKTLRDNKQYMFGVKSHFGQHRMAMQVTNLERTLVDILDRPALGGGWEEIWRSLESIDYFDVDQIIKYALLLGHAHTISLVGFYLEQHQKQLHIEERYLKILEQHCPKQPYYLERNSSQPAQFNSRWNLIIPVKIIQRTWEEQ